MRDAIGDDLLRLLFTACHPVLSRKAQGALTLRLPGGLRTAEMARAVLAPEPSIGQRIVRAKRSLMTAKLPFAARAAFERAAPLAQNQRATLFWAPGEKLHPILSKTAPPARRHHTGSQNFGRHCTPDWFPRGQHHATTHCATR